MRAIRIPQRNIQLTLFHYFKSTQFKVSNRFKKKKKNESLALASPVKAFPLLEEIL